MFKLFIMWMQIQSMFFLTRSNVLFCEKVLLLPYNSFDVVNMTELDRILKKGRITLNVRPTECFKSYLPCIHDKVEHVS
jgi:hypothetical protein